ncbi:MAG: hypothetical protein ABTQ32_22695 [Myxococcaceae bacterium]
MRSLLVLLAVTSGCGVIVDGPALKPEVPGVVAGTELEPGWYELPAEPASEFVGELTIEQWPTLLSGTVTHQLGERRVYLAMQWGDAEPVAVTGPLASGASYRALLDPPASVRTSSATCRATAKGVLLVYLEKADAPLDPRTDELIGASYKPEPYFPYEQIAYNQHIEWNECSTGSKRLLPLLLQRDPRIGLARCTEQQLTSDSCPTKRLDRTRISKAALQVSADGTLLSPSLLYQPPNVAVRYDINGQRVGDGFWQLSTTGSGPWKAGRNTLSIAIDGYAPWTAVVVLPTTPLAPKLDTTLKAGSDFTLRWTRATWATSYLVSFAPLDIPPRRQFDPRWTVTEPSLTARFEGFLDGNSAPIYAPRTKIFLSASRSQGASGVTPHGGGGFELSLSEAFIVPVQR